MKYTLDLLPINAFQGRGTPIGGQGLRLCGGSDMGGSNVGLDYGEYNPPAPAPAPAPAPEPAPAPAAEPAYSAPASEPAPVYYAPAAPAAPNWNQTINDIYQQTFGRQADPSGMASFTAALNAGMTGEQMREVLRTSAEGQSMGLSPAPAPVAPLTAAAAKPAQWEWQPGTQDEFTGAISQPYWRDVNSGAMKAADPVQYTGVNPVDSNTLAQQLAPNYEGTPTQFYDTQGNLKGVLVDTVRAGLGAKEGSLVLDPTSLGLALKPGETPSINSAVQQRNAQGQLLFIDPATGGTTIYNTGVPAETGSTVKDLMYINDPGKRGGQIPADTIQGALLLAATMATGGVGGALLNAAGLGAGAGGLTAAEAASLMGGTLSEAGAAATMGGELAGAGINWGAAATQAAKSAALNAGVTALKGGSPSDILKSGLIAAVSSGAGSALGGAGLGSLETTLAKAGLQAGITGLTGGNVANSLIASAVGAALPATLDKIIPEGMFEGFPSAIKNALTNATASAISAAATGGDISDAALNSIVRSTGNAAADYAAEATGFKGLTLEQSIDKIGRYFDTSGAKDNPEQQWVPAPSTQSDVVNSILRQDVQDVFDRNVPLPLVQNAIDQNTPTTLANVVTPPLVQNAIDQSDSERMAQTLLGFQQNPTVGAPLSTLVSATTSDINTPTASAQIPVSKILEVFQQTNPDATMSDLNFQNFVRSLPGYERTAFADSSDDVVISSSPLNPNAPFESGFKPQLPIEEYAPMLDALDKAGVTVTQKNLEDISQNPATFVSTAFQAFLGRPPTSGELANYVDQYSEAHNTSPQDLLKNIYDQIKSEFTVSLEPEPVTQAPLTPPKVEPEDVKSEKTPTSAASPTSQGNKLPAGGLGTEGGAAAGNEGAPGAVSPAGALPTSTEPETPVIDNQEQVDDADSQEIITADRADDQVEIQLATNSSLLGMSPAQAVASGLVTPDGSLTAKGVQRISDATGLSPSDVIALTNASTTARTGTGSGITSTGAGATAGAASGAALAGTGIGGSTGTNIGGLGAGTGTGVGPGAGTGTGEGSGDGLGIGLGSGSGTGTSGAGTGGVKATAAAPIVQPSYSYSGAGTQGTTAGALPGNLQATFLQGANVDEYNPFENYNVYQQLQQPIRAAEGGSPLQLAQMQQSVAGIDPSLYSVLQKRATPNYFTYGSDTSGGNPTTFAGSQLMGKPTPGIPVIPTGKASGSDWLYQGSGTNPLAMAGTGIASLGAGTMAQGGSAHGGGEGEHIPEFITGATGHYVKGRGTGQSDQIPAMLADGEWVADAATVADLGDGSSDAGARLLDEFRKVIREHKRSAPEDKIPPKASPLVYMKEALQRTGRLK